MGDLDNTLRANEPSADADTLEAESGQPPDETSATRHPDAPLEPGAKVGRYAIVDRIGAGGMGVVYRAHDPQLDRAVALKLLKRSRRHEGAADRMLREAKSAAKIRHPNVVTVYDAGEVDGHTFIAMELMRGTDLSQWFERKRPWTEVVRVMLQAAEGLRAAHRSGLVHRDFKPDNVFVEGEGSVKVLDFGLARAAYDSDTQVQVAQDLELELADQGSSPDASTVAALEKLTHTGALVGTPAYMAPEQYLLEAIDERTDQFSFCVTLFMGVYGHRPFGGRNYAALTMNVVNGTMEEPADPTRAPARLLAILRRGLARDRDDRHPSMDVLIDELSALLEAETGGLRTKRWALPGAVLGLGLVAALGYAFTNPREPGVGTPDTPEVDTANESTSGSRLPGQNDKPPRDLPLSLAEARGDNRPVAGPQLWINADTLRVIEGDGVRMAELPLDSSPPATDPAFVWAPVVEALERSRPESEASMHDPVTLYLDRGVEFAVLVRAIYNAVRAGYTRYDLAVEADAEVRVFEVQSQLYAAGEVQMQPRAALELFVGASGQVQVGARAWSPDDSALNQARLRVPLDVSGGSCEARFEAPATTGLEALARLGAALCEQNGISAPLIVSAADTVDWASIATVLDAANLSRDCSRGILIETGLEAHATCDEPLSIDEVPVALGLVTPSDEPEPAEVEFKRWCFVNRRLKNKKTCKRTQAACIAEARHWVDKPKRACRGES